MTKVKYYKYIGTNGTITTPIHLEDAKAQITYELRADEGKILIKGNQQVKFVLVPEEDVPNWKEISRV